VAADVGRINYRHVLSVVLFTPFGGNLCPIFNGNVTVPYAFTEQTLTLNIGLLGCGIVNS
jgi:hypothetical protein